MDNVVDLGDRVRDRITGLSGIVVAKTLWINGCWRMSVQPQGMDKDGKPCEVAAFDEMQLEVLETRAVASTNRDWPDEHERETDRRPT